MKYQLHIFCVAVLILTVLFISCIDENITNISDSLDLNQSYSLPIGDVSYTINDYFETLDTFQLDTLQSDTLQIDTLLTPLPDSIEFVEFNDTLYANVKYLLDTTIDTEFDFGALADDLDKIKAITLVFIIDNDFPTDTWTQVYFMDDAGNQIDSLFIEGPLLISAPELNIDGIPEERPPEIKVCPVSDYIIDNIASIRFIRVFGIVRTIRPDVNIVKFYSEYDINFHIGVRVELEFNVSEF